MARLSYLGDMLGTLFDRRSSVNGKGDPREINEMCLALLDSEGEVSGTYLAQAILTTYSELNSEEKLAFFTFLNDELEVELNDLKAAVGAFSESKEIGDYRALSRAWEPLRRELFRRLNQPPGATHALVQMRVDLLKFIAEKPELERTDVDLKVLLRAWFNRGFLVLRQISWETPASILEKIVEYEAVHAINDWDELRRRLYPSDRRCFAYFHPTMPDEPLIFVEVALTLNVPSSIQYVLADTRDYRDIQETKVAVFYSISNCQEGLRGISFGNLLIKHVVDELKQELPSTELFVTLSPILGFKKWLEQQADNLDAESVLSGNAQADTVRFLAETYLLDAKNLRGGPADPVARFHLGNGAQIHAVHADADLSDNGMRQSMGAMVNYHYDLEMIEQNHLSFVQEGSISVSQDFAKRRTSAKKKKRK